MAEQDNLLLEDAKHYDLVIVSDRNSDFLFDEIREDWKKSNNMFNVQPYSHFYEGNLDFLKDSNVNKPVAAPSARGVGMKMDSLNNTQGRSNSTQEYLKPNDILANYNKIITNHLNNGVNRLLKEAHDKRENIVNVFLGNPYIPSSEKFYFRASDNAKGAATACCGDGPLNIVIYGIIMFFAYPIFWILCLVDLASGITEANRGSPKEKEWLESTMLAHPQLETTQINQRVADDLKTMASTLARVYPQAAYEIVTGEDTTTDGKRRQKFILRIKPKGVNATSSATAVVTTAPADVKVSIDGHGDNQV
jgi:hypothetical protein